MQSGLYNLELKNDTHNTMTQNYISHDGIVDSISKGCVQVRIVQNSACASCKVATYCTSAESKEKIIDVYTSHYDDYAIGDKVEVMARVGVGFRAVLFGFVIPAILIFSVPFFAIYGLHLTEDKAALLGLASLIPYYTLLYMFKGAMKKMMVFHIQDKISKN